MFLIIFPMQFHGFIHLWQTQTNHDPYAKSQHFCWWKIQKKWLVKTLWRSFLKFDHVNQSPDILMQKTPHFWNADIFFFPVKVPNYVSHNQLWIYHGFTMDLPWIYLWNDGALFIAKSLRSSAALPPPATSPQVQASKISMGNLDQKSRCLRHGP